MTKMVNVNELDLQHLCQQRKQKNYERCSRPELLGPRFPSFNLHRSLPLSSAFAFMGVGLEGHLTATRWDAFTRAGAQPIRELPHLKHGQKVKTGLIVARQHPPTAKGFCFLAVEDPDGMVNVVVPPAVYEQCREAIHSVFVIIEGVVQKDHGAINFLAAAVREV
jgi:DNA polymerase III alpha subunit